MARVFLSHSSRDNAAAAELKAWLDRQGFAQAFLDFDKHSGIPAGADWERTLYDQIQRCQALLILQTPNWSASRWCFAEFVQARALGKPIFQVVESEEAAAEKPIAVDLQRLDLRHDRAAGLEQLRQELELIALQDQGGFPWPPLEDPSRPPFPGLMVFEAEDAPVFFGRDNDWRVVNERLRTRRVQGGPRLLVLLGASGSGKSSLLRAGVLPRLNRAGREWLVLPVLRPQTRPLESLAQTLAVALKLPGDWRYLQQQLLTTTEPAALVNLFAGWAADLRLAAATPQAQLLLPIDQAEELFTVADQVERQRFVTVLATALQPPLPLQAVMTIRADAMGSLQSLPELVNILETLPLGPLSLERYREIIEGPARVAGLTAEPAFVERAIHDTATEDALPLLAFALRQLHDQYGGDGVLSLNDYETLGDPAAGLSPLENAVKQAADGVLQAQRPDQASLKALREAFVPALVRVSEQGSYARRPAIWDTLPQAARPLLESLVAARLLVRRQREGEPSTVEVTHEALLRVWPLLRGWLDNSRDFLLGSQQLEQDLSQWQEASPADQPLALLSGLKLAKGLAWLAERGEQLRPELRSFIQASQRRAERQRRLLVGTAVAAFVVISGVAGLAFLQLQRARAAQAAQFKANHLALLAFDPFASLVNGLAAAEQLLNNQDQWLAAQLSISLAKALQSNLLVAPPINTDQISVLSLVELKNGDVMSGGLDGTLRRWRDSRPIGEPIYTGQKNGIIRIVELSTGEIISLGRDYTLKSWRDGNKVDPGEIAKSKYNIQSLIGLANGQLLSVSGNGLLQYWRDGKPLGGPIATGQNVTIVTELKNGEIVSGGFDGTLKRWLGRKPAGDPILTGQNAILALIELKNGELVSGGRDGSLRRWRDGKSAGELIKTSHGKISSLIELDNGVVVSAGWDGKMRRWRDGAAADQGKDTTTNRGVIFDLVQTRAGELISASGDGRIYRWKIPHSSFAGQPITTNQGGVRSLIELKNGEIVSGGIDGSLRRWLNDKPVDGGKPILAKQGVVSSLIELKSGELVSGGEDGTLRRWQNGKPIDNGPWISTGSSPVIGLIQLENGELISGGWDGTLRFWRNNYPARQAITLDQSGLWSLVRLKNGSIITVGEDGFLKSWHNGKLSGRPIDTGQGPEFATVGLTVLNNGDLISSGPNGSLQRWREGRTKGDGIPIVTGLKTVWSVASLRNGDLVVGSSNGYLMPISLPAIVKNACSIIDLNSLVNYVNYEAASMAAQNACKNRNLRKYVAG